MKKILVSILILFNLVLSSCNKETISNDFIIENYFQWDINMSAKNLKQIPDFNKIASWSYINEVVSINLLSNQIETLDWSKFKIFPNLQKINISFNNISKFKNLDNLNVNYIDLSKNKISNLDWIWDLSNIKNLNLNFNEISDVNKLTNLKSLVALHLAHNQIEEINQFIYFQTSFQSQWKLITKNLTIAV